MSLVDARRHRLSRLRLLGADPADAGDRVTWRGALRPWRNIRLEMVTRPEGSQGFRLLPKRWMVERTFAWLGRYRRVSQEDES